MLYKYIPIFYHWPAVDLIGLDENFLSEVCIKKQRLLTIAEKEVVSGSGTLPVVNAIAYFSIMLAVCKLDKNCA